MIDDYEFVPGTVHLVDVDGVLDVKKADSEVILQPQPTDNVNDPLRWSQRKKYFQFGLVWFWGFILAVSANFAGPAYEAWIDSLNTTTAQINVSQALLYLFLGLGCLFLQPTAMKLGRRFVYLFCTLIVVLAMVVGGVATNIGHLIGSMIMIGFAAAPVDSLIEISSTDVFFQHERSTAMALMVLALYAGSNLGPVATGFIVDSMKVEWLFWIQIFIYAGLSVVLVFCMYDTTFRRDPEEDDRVNEDILSTIRSHETSGMVSPRETKDHYDVIVTHDASSDSEPLRSYWKNIQLFELEYNDERSWLVIFVKPFLLVSFPAVVWSSLVYGAQIMWLSLMGTTQSQMFSAPPYNFKSSVVGLTNLAPFVGCVLGMFYGGNFVDWLAVKLARRNRGIFEPEMRLYAMIVPTAVNAAGLLAYGLGVNSGSHWAIPVILGYGFLGFSMSSSGAICLTYTIDSYHHLASEALVIMLLFRNLIGMAFCFAIQPWLDSCGLVTTTWLMFMLAMVINGSFIAMIWYGKRFRKWTTKRYHQYSAPSFGEFWKHK
ncbi:protein Hol1p [Diutina catenulata]